MSATDIRRLIQQIVGDMRNLPIQGEVISVDGETCSVRIASGLELQGVRLKATVTEGKQKVLSTPAEGSSVLMLSVGGGLDNLVVISIDEVSKIEIITEDVAVLVDDKVSIEVGGVKLADTLANLCDAIKTLTVSTGVGPSGTPLPPTIQKVQQLENDFKTLFK